MRLKLFFMCISLVASLSGENIQKRFEWLENSESLQTQTWIKQQRSIFNAYMAETTSREEIKESLIKFTNFEVYSIPRKIGDNFYYISKHNLYIQHELNETPQAILDPNLLQKNASIDNFVVSPNESYLAYSTSENGSDWLTCHIINLNSKMKLPDYVEKIKFSSIVWSAKSDGFFYSRFDGGSTHGIYFHALGSKQSEDHLVYQDLSDGSLGYIPFISRDNRYLVIDGFNGSSGPHSITLLDIQANNSKPIKIIPCDGANYWFICNHDTKFYFLTDKDANFRKVIYIDLSDKTYTPQDFIPESKSLLEGVVPLGNYFCVVTSENVVNKLALYDSLGKFVKYISTPTPGKISLNKINQNSTSSENEIFFSFTSFFQPPLIYRYCLDSDAPEVFKESKPPIDLNDFVMEQVFYPSKDGTKVPLFIIYKKGIQLDGNNPTLLTGYGAYGIINHPTFNASHVFWLNRGGILALANIRGGGEGGENWHKAAIREKKQNSFDDFIAAAEWLIKNKYTCESYLVANGMSSGGLLVAASANQRPDLFKVIVVEAGLLDMLRFHLFTIGRFWINEHGDPEDPNDLVYLRKYSPCHNVNKVEKFPAVLVTASEDDDRVVPLHSYKYLATLQNIYKNNNMLLRLSSKVGHDSTQCYNWIDERADILTFILHEFNLD